jgi:arsenate reductase-like glutaredoxin family protein
MSSQSSRNEMVSLAGSSYNNKSQLKQSNRYQTFPTESDLQQRFKTFASQIEQLLSNSSEVIAQLPVDKTQ